MRWKNVEPAQFKLSRHFIIHLSFNMSQSSSVYSANTSGDTSANAESPSQTSSFATTNHQPQQQYQQHQQYPVTSDWIAAAPLGRERKVYFVELPKRQQQQPPLDRCSDTFTKLTKEKYPKGCTDRIARWILKFGPNSTRVWELKQN
jgi:hypothetical protein